VELGLKLGDSAAPRLHLGPQQDTNVAESNQTVWGCIVTCKLMSYATFRMAAVPFASSFMF
jgi:hypothetical protein